MLRFRDALAVLLPALLVVPSAVAQEGEVLPVDVVFSLGDVEAAPGTEVEVPFFINVAETSLGARAFSFSIDFDEEKLQGGDPQIVWTNRGLRPDFVSLKVNNRNNTPGSAGVDEGYVIGGIVYAFEQQVVLPFEEDVEVLRFPFSVLESAPDGTTVVRFLDGGAQNFDTGEVPVPNYVTVDVELPDGSFEGQAVTPDLAESFVFVDCTLAIREIVVDIAVFRRGDTNSDELINLTDPIATLNHLFLDSDPLPCADAADVDDDGELTITDGVYTLTFLYLGGPPPEAPGPYAPGADPTEDELDCEDGAEES